jgi:glycosyltransferase involved in cell wall biosynthesis
MTSSGLLVSAIIPVYNGEAFLAEAVASIQRQLVDALEIIIVNDGSTDGTSEVIEGLQGAIQSVSQPNRGPAAARSRGVRMARGNVIAFLDADDLWPEDKLEIQLAHLARHPAVDIVLGQTQRIRQFTRDGGAQVYEKGADPWTTLMFGAAVIRTSAFDTVGLPDESFQFDDDVDWFLRARELGLSILTHPDVAVFYRRHKANLTNQRATDQRYFLMALKRSIDRRRRAGSGRVKLLDDWFDDDTRDSGA